jgi:uncharacterized membrane protein YdcZ (DUF606 family)
MSYLRRWWIVLLAIWVTFFLGDAVSATVESIPRDENQSASNTTELPPWIVFELPIAGTLGAMFVAAGIVPLVRRLSSPASKDSGDQANSGTGQ